MGTFVFDFAGALVVPFAGVFLPLVAVVHPGAAQQARQLIPGLRVVFDQLSDGTELSLQFLR